MSPAARAFDSIADRFDERFGEWRSVAAQRDAVRDELERTFPRGSRLIEIGGGTGEDALWLVRRGRDVVMTDPSPQMVRVASGKLAECIGGRAEVASAEVLQPKEAPYDGAFSNFAALNCVSDLKPFAHGLAKLLRPGAAVVLVLFGTFSPGEMIVEALRRRPRNMFRRLARGEVPANLGGETFMVRYHRRTEIEHAMAPWFTLEARKGIGIFVPSSAAEPWISRHPHLLGAMSALDRLLANLLAPLGDHVLYRFRRTHAPGDDR